MRLTRNQRILVSGLPGVWKAVYMIKGTSQWVIIPITTTKGLAELCSLGTMEVDRRDLTPLTNQETLL